VAEHVVDEFESGDVNDYDCDAPAPLRSQVPQRSVELVHEKSSIRQSGDCIVKARVVEGFLQSEALLYFGRQVLIDQVQPPPRGCQGGA
jgi:hypothetical protein